MSSRPGLIRKVEHIKVFDMEGEMVAKENNPFSYTYQKEYYYIKFFVKGHEKDLPCFEIRSRDFKYDKSSEKCSIVVRAVLYNLTEQANAKSIEAWQQSLKKHGFSLNHRTDITKHKQIGIIEITNFENNDQALTNVFNNISILLSEIF